MHAPDAEILDTERVAESRADRRARRTWKQAIEGEVRSHAFGYGVLVVALLVAPFLILRIFPGVTPLQAIIGGLAFGVYLALCAVPQKFM